jgi:hypothetical protein
LCQPQSIRCLSQLAMIKPSSLRTLHFGRYLMFGGLRRTTLCCEKRHSSRQQATALLDDADSPISGRQWCFAAIRSSTRSIAALRPNAVVERAGSPKSGHRISKVALADLFEDPDSLLLFSRGIMRGIHSGHKSLPVQKILKVKSPFSLSANTPVLH